MTWSTGFEFKPNMTLFANRFYCYGEDPEEQKELQNLKVKYNPIESDSDLKKIALLQVETLNSIQKMSYKHAYVTFNYLKELIQSNDEFSNIFKDDILEEFSETDEENIYVPWHLDNNRTKEYLSLLLDILSTEWKDDIAKGSREDSSIW